MTFLIKKTSSDQFGVIAFAKCFLYFDILTWSTTLNLGSNFMAKLVYMPDATSADFILIVLWYMLLHLPTI